MTVDLKIQDSVIPSGAGAVNPYAHHVAELNSDRTKAKSFPLPDYDKSGTDEAKAKNAKAVDKILRVWRDAGSAAGVSVKSKFADGIVTVWVVDKVTRTRRVADPAGPQTD